jgi:hypothetical protein
MNEPTVVNLRTRRPIKAITNEARTCMEIRKFYKKLCAAINRAQKEHGLKVKVYLDSSDTYGNNLVRGREIEITKRL